MSTISTIAGSDTITSSRTVINTNFSNLNADKEEISNKSTDTALTANSDTLYPTQKAVKAYVDTVGVATATTLIKGIVEVATQAEVDAGTATGGTGASLVVTPATMKVFSVTAGATINGATLPVPVYQDSSTGKYLACDGNVLTALAYQGFATSNGTDTNPINVRFDGVVSGFSALTVGSKYYLNDTVGTITTTLGTYEVLVGIAVSSTQILILKGKRTASGTLTVSATGSNVQTVGFRVSKVRVHAISTVTGATTAGMVRSNGGYTKFGGNSCILVGDGSRSASSSFCYSLSTPGVPSSHNGTIASITDTTFDISNTKTGSQADGLIFWEAEGDL